MESMYRGHRAKGPGRQGVEKVTICSLTNEDLPDGRGKGSQWEAEPGSCGNCKQDMTRKSGMSPARIEAGRQVRARIGESFLHCK